MEDKKMTRKMRISKEMKKIKQNKRLKRKKIFIYIAIFIISITAMVSINTLTQFIIEIPNGEFSMIFIQDLSKENALLICNMVKKIIYFLFVLIVLCIELDD